MWRCSYVQGGACVSVCVVQMVEVYSLLQMSVKIASGLCICIPLQDNGLLLVWYVCCGSPVCVCKRQKRLVCEYDSEKAGD